MKKLILAMVFVFATGTIMNATSTNNLNPDPIDCATSAWNEADEVNASYAAASGHSYSEWDLWEITNTLYEDCMGEN
ncbi:hypothetical protein [uncultured Polaribacter sp.]|uniref:hypothetical protein n=1 Tax=uncultured Polaribacter sp. TaxID=174711 RepID=UPI0026296FEB|nr:hypothetical protein [uncultured Polaribacter sp.]